MDTEDIDINLRDVNLDNNCFRADVITGLQKRQKEIPTKYFYDARGSELFQSICTLDEYYIPSVETAIMKANIKEIVGLLGEGVILIEYGCGDCAKTRILLQHLPNPAAYVPVDISRKQLAAVATQLIADYPDLEILPLCADYTSTLSLPSPKKLGKRKAVYFPGSSIGNFDPHMAAVFLKRINRLCGKNGALLIGIDLKKDPEVLNRAYNDSRGVTAAFNLNLLKRINRELGGDFKPGNFKHQAFYNISKGRVEMHLISLKEQVLHLDNLSVYLTEGESIWTESSYKYDEREFECMASIAGFELKKAWTDDKNWFSVMYFAKVG